MSTPSLRPVTFQVDCQGQASRLLGQIYSNTEKYLAHFKAQSLPEPSFEHGDKLEHSSPLPPDVVLAREAALEATDELHHLLLGPVGLIASCPADQYLMLALQYILRHQIAHQVPVNEEISFNELAERTGLEVKDMVVFLRLAITRHVFQEPRKGFIRHTAASEVFLSTPLLDDFINYVAQEIWPSLTRGVDATKKWPRSEEPGESGYSLANNTAENAFEVIRKDPAKTKQFARGVKFSHMSSLYHMDSLLLTYDFSKTSVLVDVGGSTGGVSIELASRYPHLTCIVQDLPETIMNLDKYIPDNVKDRVKGMEHDFFSPQPVLVADVFFLRWVLHDWSDKYCVKILRALIPALKPGSKLLVNEVCMPEPGQIPLGPERSMRSMDLSLKAFSNARERDHDGWLSLFKEADERFLIKEIRVAPGSCMALIEVHWTE